MTMPSRVRITDKGLEHVVLGWVIHPDEDGAIDAAKFADSIVELLHKGYLRIEGTFSSAVLVATDAGKEAYEAFNREIEAAASRGSQ